MNLHKTQSMYMFEGRDRYLHKSLINVKMVEWTTVSVNY
jgi:hypothetical protein